LRGDVEYTRKNPKCLSAGWQHKSSADREPAVAPKPRGKRHDIRRWDGTKRSGAGAEAPAQIPRVRAARI